MDDDDGLVRVEFDLDEESYARFVMMAALAGTSVEDAFAEWYSIGAMLIRDSPEPVRAEVLGARIREIYELRHLAPESL